MSVALSSGVTGLESYQKMLDIAGDNLANVGTTAFKSSRITFSQLLSQTIQSASPPTSNIGGTNPQQIGHGVGVAGITPILTQGSLSDTGNPLDLAIEGQGYFTLNDGSTDLYTRAGAFAIDANSRLVDPATGFIVQRIGTTGESDGFQIAGDSTVRIPTNVSMPALATSQIGVAGNLSTTAAFANTQINKMASNISFTSSGSPANSTTRISQLDQYTGSTWANGTMTFSGYKSDGTALGGTPTVDLTMPVTSATTLGDVLTWLNTNEGTSAVSELQTLTPDAVATAGTFTLTYGGETTAAIAFNAPTTGVGSIQEALEALSGVTAGDLTVGGTTLAAAGTTTFTFANTVGDANAISFDLSGLTGPTQGGSTIAETTKGFKVQGVFGSDATAALSNGKLTITDATAGYSKADFKMAWSDTNLTMPAYFEVNTVGGEEVKSVNITVFDTQGGKHVLSGAFVRTGTPNTWDMILTSISGNITDITFDNRRINGVEFFANDGSFKGLNAVIGDTSQFAVNFAHDPSNPQTIDVSMGTAGQFNGLTQFDANSTAVARDQNGYAAGSFSRLAVSNDGIIIGSFTNGIKKDIATLQLALFQNPTALESLGDGYFSPSGNSGGAIATQAQSGGAGSLRGGALEGSNVNTAKEFVSMIQSQNYYQASARTIRIANELLRELTNLIR
ncbi:MAG: flagellar hook-basal body complex protein [Planctomycetes bacterium]|nr:flagellar hook-basal body complex protein [Planctomycetota bacterium]